MLHRASFKMFIAAAALTWSVAAHADIEVSGRVVSPEGHGLKGATVSLFVNGNRFQESLHRQGGETRGPATETVRSVAGGSFRLTAPAAGLYTVVVEAPGRLPWQYPLPLLEPTALPTIALGRAREHRIRAVGADGGPVRGALATVGEASRWSRQKPAFGDWLPAAQVARSDADGEMSFSRETVRGVELLVWAPGFLELALPSGRRDSVTARLTRGLERVIEIRDGADAPAADVLVRLGVGKWPVGRTDAHGRLTLPAPRDRSLPLELVTAEGWASSVRLLPPASTGADRGSEGEAAEVFYFEPEVIEGRVVSGGRGEALGGALVWTSADLGTYAWSDAQGRFRLPDGGTEGFKLYGEAGDHLGRRTDGVPVDGSGAVELVLEPAVTLRGRLVDVDARPVTGVEIQVHADLSRNHLLEPPLSVAARSDGDGRFTLPRLPEAPIYELITRASGFAASVFAVTRPEGGGPLELVLRRGRQVVGDIVDAAGQPITNAAAMLYPSRRADRGRLLVDDVHVGVSGGEGIFSMDHVLAGRYELGVSADGFAPLKVPDLEILDGDGALDLGTIDLEAESTLGGRVVDVDDRPLAGASISYLALAYEVGPDDDQLSTMKTTGTDGDGRFMIRQLASDQLLDLKVRRTGYRERRLVGVEASGGEPLVVTLDPVAQIFGRVVDEEGSPVPSAHLVVDPLEDFDAGVTAAIGGEPRTTTADGRGHFTLTAPEPGAYRIRASADTYLPSRDHTFEVRDDLSAEPLTLVVREGARIAGRVLDVEGRPVAGARVRVVEPAPRRAEAAAEGRSRSDGSYELDGLEVGPTRFEVVHGDFPRAFRTLELHGALHRLDVTLDPGAELRGRVVGETRSPIAGALLRLEVVDGPRQPRKSAQSDTDGSFRLRGVPVGSYRLRATKEGLAEAAVTVQVDSLGALGGPLELEMRGGGVVIGQVYGLVGSEWDRLTVAARRPGHREVPGSVDFEGAFRVEHLAAGEWSLEASLRGEPGRRASSPLRIEAAAPEVYRDLDFESGLIVAGDVRRDGGPVAGALVALVREDLSTSGGARSGLDGRFVLTGVEPGRYDLNVKDPETGYFHRRTLEVEADRELVVELELGQATIDGPVEQASGGPAPSGGAP